MNATLFAIYSALVFAGGAIAGGVAVKYRSGDLFTAKAAAEQLEAAATTQSDLVFQKTITDAIIKNARAKIAEKAVRVNCPDGLGGVSSDVDARLRAAFAAD